MKSSKLIAALLAVSMIAAAPLASADYDRGPGPRYDRHDDRWDHGRRDDDRRGDYHRDDYRGGPPGPRYDGPGRGPDFRGPPHWARGHYLPRDYRQPRYVVVDWHDHHLRPPPRGYHWMRVDGGDFLLVAIATGIITQVILSR
ncbi:hypothetical protein GRF61_04705 [Azoarcus sp. TTM-91]|uniref:RcnB family protein n=1 Tax=Azoarcus sp. TTM-91 TaxID=2691581 RepID=UPI00145E9169|nr:RcnB family protein [Azoarcus sp. TTM-91]NMG33748.1 hypothetical protein [Azoarcus sp. TTM-91]